MEKRLIKESSPSQRRKGRGSRLIRRFLAAVAVVLATAIGLSTFGAQRADAYSTGPNGAQWTGAWVVCDPFTGRITVAPQLGSAYKYRSQLVAWRFNLYDATNRRWVTEKESPVFYGIAPQTVTGVTRDYQGNTTEHISSIWAQAPTHVFRHKSNVQVYTEYWWADAQGRWSPTNSQGRSVYGAWGSRYEQRFGYSGFTATVVDRCHG
jgi:hypothetical protein